MAAAAAAVAAAVAAAALAAAAAAVAAAVVAAAKAAVSAAEAQWCSCVQGVDCSVGRARELLCVRAAGCWGLR